MEILVPLLIIVIIVGAILGGKSFGGTIRKGCGFLVVIIVLILAIVFILYTRTELKEDSTNQKEVSITHESAYFYVNQDCQAYTKPNIESDTSEYLNLGTELFVENVNKFIYFFEVINENEDKIYIRKEFLTKK
jgi:hypothetical protein